MSWSSGLQFRVIDGQRERDRVIRLDGKELRLGRAQKGQRPGIGEILFREPTVSRVHVSLSWKERKGGFQLTHKSGTNPTLVNGKPVKKVMLCPGDKVQMGLLILELEPAPAGRSRESLGGSFESRGRSSMTEPILQALSKVERENEEERRRERAEREKKQRQREMMASPDEYPSRQPNPSPRSARLNEALSEAGFSPRRQDPIPERPKDRNIPTFGWRPPEEREPQPPTPRARPTVSYEDDVNRRRQAEISFQSRAEVSAPTSQQEATYELVVILGPDQGKRFPLKDMVMVLGQRQGDSDPREGQGVLLNDSLIPAEVAMFAWQGREGSYGLLASDNSRETLEVDRISEGARQRLRVDSSSSILLKVADEIRVGSTTLRVQKIGEPLPAAMTRPPISLPQSEFTPPPASPQGPQALRGGRDPLPPTPSFSKPPPPVKFAEPSPPPNIAAPNEEVPIWAEATLVPGRRSEVPPPSQSPPPPAKAHKTEPDEILTWGKRPAVDYLFEFIEGPSRGCQVSLSRQELGRSRQLFAGGPGIRANELMLDGPGIPNSAFTINTDEGRFSLLNECPTGELQVNRQPQKSGDRLVLMTGDTIAIGNNVLRFLEREVVNMLSQHGLFAESGVTSDQDRIFPLIRQRITVGRGKGCDIRLSDLEVSRLHLGISYSEGRFSVQHRSETNPTFLNGLSLLPGTVRTIKVGDKVRLSSLTVLRFINRNELP